jgi:hypothetical protein
VIHLPDKTGIGQRIGRNIITACWLSTSRLAFPSEVQLMVDSERLLGDINDLQLGPWLKGSKDSLNAFISDLLHHQLYFHEYSISLQTQ